MGAFVPRRSSSAGFDGSNSAIKRTTGEALSAAVNVLSLPYFQKQIQRMNQSVESDPDLAIGTAKELIESACKQILSQQGIEPDSNWKLARLVKETQKGLNLVSDELSNEAKAVGALKKILGSLANIVQGPVRVFVNYLLNRK